MNYYYNPVEEKKFIIHNS